MKPAKTTRHNASVKTPSHYENMPIQILKTFTHKHTHKKNFFQIKKSDIFSYFCSKHRLWVSTSMFLSRNKKNNVYPGKPQFYYIKVGFKGVKII